MIKIKIEADDQRLAVGIQRACWMLDIGRQSLERLIETGEIPARRLQRKILIPVAALQEFASGRKVKHGEEA